MCTKLTTDDFIKTSSKVHGGKYGYSLSEYIDAGTKVKIICPIHGVFEQVASVHKCGSGCTKCVGKYKKTSEEFIIEAIEVHGLMYDYTPTIYKNAYTKLSINCKIHGNFKQTPNDHLRGSGCFICSVDRRRKPLSEFIEQANIRHNGKYDYTKVNYVNTDTKISIGCPTHGIFEQRSSDHIRGSGCPKCVNSVTRPEKAWLSYMNIPDTPENRQLNIWVNGKRYKVDGYIAETNTIYEYNGDFWHGNPALYRMEDINPKNKKTFGDLYTETQNKRQVLVDAGYNFIEIWGNDWSAIQGSLLDAEKINIIE